MCLKAAYTVGELARLSGLEARRVRRVLLHAGVPLRTFGGRYALVMLSDLKAQFPEFWESCLDRLAAAGESLGGPGRTGEDQGGPWVGPTS